MIEGLKPYPRMKDSGVAWLGRVPQHWDVQRGKWLFRTKKEINFEQRNANVLSLTLRGVVNNDADAPEGLVPKDYGTYQLFSKGDLVFKLIDLENLRTSRVGLVHQDGIMSPAYVRLIPVHEGQQRYFFHQYFDLYQRGIFNQLGAGVRSTLGATDLLQLPVGVPPPSEQSAIVRFLDHADRRIRKYIRAKQKLIKLLEEQKQAIMHRAVTRGLDPNVRLKPSGVEWLGEVPEHWEVRRAKAICSAIVDCKNRTPDAIDGGRYLVVRTTCVRGGRFDPAGGYATDEAYYRIWTSRGAPRHGDVFFTREAPAGEACLVPNRTDLCMGQRMMYFRPDPELLDAEFLLLSIYGPLTRTYVELATNGSTVGHLRLGQVYALPILWCTAEEQHAIVRYVRDATKGIEKTQAGAEREIALLREYRTRLIADVVTGKLDVREAAARLPQEAEDLEPLDEAELEGDAQEADAGAANDEPDEVET